MHGAIHALDFINGISWVAGAWLTDEIQGMFVYFDVNPLRNNELERVLSARGMVLVNICATQICLLPTYPPRELSNYVGGWVSVNACGCPIVSMSAYVVLLHVTLVVT